MPIILLTAKVQDGDVQRGFDAGADDYVRKPFSPQELRSRVQAILGRGRPARDPALVVLLGPGPAVLVLALIVRRTWRSARDRGCARWPNACGPRRSSWWTPRTGAPRPLRRGGGCSPSCWRTTRDAARTTTRTDRRVLRVRRGGPAAARAAQPPWTGWEAAFGLGDMASERAIPDLLLALDDRERRRQGRGDQEPRSPRRHGRRSSPSSVPRSRSGFPVGHRWALLEIGPRCPTCWTCWTTATPPFGSTPPTSSGCSARPTPPRSCPGCATPPRRSVPPGPRQWTARRQRRAGPADRPAGGPGAVRPGRRRPRARTDRRSGGGCRAARGGPPRRVRPGRGGRQGAGADRPGALVLRGGPRRGPHLREAADRLAL